MIALFSIFALVTFLFSDWIIATIWVFAEVVYCKKHMVKDYKPDIKARRELVKKDMLEKADKYWR